MGDHPELPYRINEINEQNPAHPLSEKGVQSATYFKNSEGLSSKLKADVRGVINCCAVTLDNDEQVAKHLDLISKLGEKYCLDYILIDERKPEKVFLYPYFTLDFDSWARTAVGNDANAALSVLPPVIRKLLKICVDMEKKGLKLQPSKTILDGCIAMIDGDPYVLACPLANDGEDLKKSIQVILKKFFDLVTLNGRLAITSMGNNVQKSFDHLLKEDLLSDCSSEDYEKLLWDPIFCSTEKKLNLFKYVRELFRNRWSKLRFLINEILSWPSVYGDYPNKRLVSVYKKLLFFRNQYYVSYTTGWDVFGFTRVCIEHFSAACKDVQIEAKANTSINTFIIHRVFSDGQVLETLEVDFNLMWHIGELVKSVLRRDCNPNQKDIRDEEWIAEKENLKSLLVL